MKKVESKEIPTNNKKKKRIKNENQIKLKLQRKIHSTFIEIITSDE